jgi:predicted nucleic acid-binding protein
MAIELIYWDTDAFLSHFQGEAGKVELCEGTLERAYRGEVLILTSALTISEILWLKGATPIPKKKAAILNRYFRRSCFRIRNVTRKIAESAQDVVWNHGIKPKDAIHVATALAESIPTLETFDRDLIGASGTIGDPALVIRKPRAPIQTTLPV